MNIEDVSRLSFACAYSSSEEFEAALIQNRRDAGAYGPSRQRQNAIRGLGIAIGLLIVVCIIIAS
ncbi:MAG TPA: hypothetical protein VJL90_10075 [Pseudorhodoplanes sp.]|nr:hypothetical protein [Pseudorhodoplanes sp.]